MYIFFFPFLEEFHLFPPSALFFLFVNVIPVYLSEKMLCFVCMVVYIQMLIKNMQQTLMSFELSIIHLRHEVIVICQSGVFGSL